MLNHSIPRSVTYILLILISGMVCAGFAMADAQITYRLKWLRNMSTVGDIYAFTNGSFKAEGLDVTIKPGGPEIDAIRELELGQAQFGVASADQVIRAVAKGSPVVVIAQLFQVNPLQWIYRPDRVVVRQPTDLKGKTLGVTFGKNDEIIMRTLMVRAQIHLAQQQYRQALADSEKALQHKTNQVDWYLIRHQIQWHLGLTAQGMQGLRQGYEQTGSFVLEKEWIEALIDAAQSVDCDLLDLVTDPGPRSDDLVVSLVLGDRHVAVLPVDL